MGPKEKIVVVLFRHNLLFWLIRKRVDFDFLLIRFCVQKVDRAFKIWLNFVVITVGKNYLLGSDSFFNHNQDRGKNKWNLDSI